MNMTLEEFNNYRFGVKTQVLYDDNWYKVDSVDFEEGLILPKEFGVWVLFSDITEIKN